MMRFKLNKERDKTVLSRYAMDMVRGCVKVVRSPRKRMKCTVPLNQGCYLDQGMHGVST